MPRHLRANQAPNGYLSLAVSAGGSWQIFTAKLLFLANLVNYIKLTFVVVGHEILLMRLFCAPHLLCQGVSAPLPHLNCATDII